MAQSYFPFDSGAGANVTEDQWAKMGALWLPTGVVRGALAGNLAVAAGTGMQVTVAAGRAWHSGFCYENDATLTLAVDAADATNPRIDRVALRLDRIANTIQALILKGTPATSPVPPALSATATVIDLPLAQYRVNAGASAPSSFVDERQMTSPPAGILAYQTAVSNQSNGTTTEVVLLNTTTPLIWIPANRRIKVTGHAYPSSTVADDAVLIRIRQGTTQIQGIDRTLSVANRGDTFEACVVITPTAGLHDFSLTMQRTAGTGTITNNASATTPTFVLVEDIGPA